LPKPNKTHRSRAGRALVEHKIAYVDEISFADKNDVEEIDKKTRLLKQNLTSRYGGIDIIFAGDLRQLEPVGKFTKPIYE
jgi:hypothetical protein